MEKYISKSAVVAEINRVLNSYDPNEITSGRYALVSLRNFINTLEVKEKNEGIKSNDLEEAARKNVVLETKVVKDSDGDGIDTPYEEWLTLEDTEIPFIPDDIGLKDGDKVKVIIIKK